MNAKSGSRDSKEHRTGWGPIVDPAIYDRFPRLSNAERRGLEEFRLLRESVSRGRRLPDRLVHDLGRLLTPIGDVLDTIQASSRNRGFATDLLLETMCERQTAFWCWSREEWRTLLNRVDQQRSSRQYSMAVAYLLCGYNDLHVDFFRFRSRSFANKVFGQEVVEATLERTAAELSRWGYLEPKRTFGLQSTICNLLLVARSPHLESITPEVVAVALGEKPPRYFHREVRAVSRILTGMGILNAPVAGPSRARKNGFKPLVARKTGVSEVWAEWCQRWHDTSTLSAGTRRHTYNNLLKAGRWLDACHPEMTEPNQWTRELAAEYVAAVDRMTVGQWSYSVTYRPEKAGKPLAPATKAGHIASIRTFFRDGVGWGWFNIRFDPMRSFATPRSILALIGPDPRNIVSDVWAKLLWAGLNLSAEDLSSRSPLGRGRGYPLEMVRAIAITWLFCGLRSNELRRLTVGCVEWQREDLVVSETSEVLPKDAVCRLRVPVNKTSKAFLKPVDRVVGEAITAWERVRPQQTPTMDKKTGETVHFLFSCHNRHTGRGYLNKWLILLLCRKAGVPEEDASGKITSHRARSTIASQLANAKEPMTLLELKEWLGHNNLESTLRYVRTSQTKLSKAYADTGYFARNVRAVEVLIDQEAVRGGAAANGEPWKHYDLGHGYCTYDFFEQCPHRMACVHCGFYLPKGSTKTLLLEGKDNLARMQQEIPLSEEELAAVDDGIGAHEKLLSKLADVPTPAGPTPRELGADIPNDEPSRNGNGSSASQNVPLIPLESLRRKPHTENGQQ